MAVEHGQSDKAGSSNPGGNLSDADLARRLDRLSRDLDAERRERAVAQAPRNSAGGYGLAFKLGSEFIAAVIVGAALGWGLDVVAGTSPWGMIVLLLLGFCAGVLNVLRSANRMSGAQAGRSGPASGGPGPH